MLKTLREQFKHLKWILWFVVFLFVFFIFVDWGTGRARARSGLAGLAAKVGDVSITETQFIRELRGTEDRYRQLYGKQYDSVRDQIDFATITIGNMINRFLMIEEAHALGLTVTDQEVLDRIMSYPVFKRSDGSFVGDQLYERILRANQSSPEEFEQSLRNEILLEKLQKALSAGIYVSDADLERTYRQRNESASFDLLFVPVDRALSETTVSDAEARAYFDKNPTKFSHPQQRQLRYLLVDEAKLRRTLSAPAAEIEKYYTAHAAEFQQPEQARARHILIRPKREDATGWNEALTRAQDVHAKAVAAGADFAALARQYSEDPGSKESGGDLGWFARGRMVKEFEDAVFALKPGEVSGPVKSQFGYHVIRLEERKAASTRPLVEVRDIIRDKLVEGQADSEGSRRATALRGKIDAGKLASDEQWRALADDVITSNVTPFFSQGDVIPGLGRDPELIAEVMAAKESAVGGPRRSARGWIVYRVAKVRPAGTSTFDDAKEEARDGARRVKALEQLRQSLDAKRAALAASPLAQHAAALGGTAQTVTEHRRGAQITGVGSSKPLDDAVFATAVGSLTPAAIVADRGVAVAKVTAKKVADMQAFAREKDTLRTTMVNDEVQRLLTALLAEAKRENNVTINAEVIDRFKPKRG
jgi:peptidyl-prolyl cis-trans isomerase D